MKNKQTANTEAIRRIEPLSWWIGMKTPLQIMLYGDNLTGSEVKVKEKGVTVEKIHNADSPNYIFVDVSIQNDITPGYYTFIVEKEGKSYEFQYLLEERKHNSALRKSFTSADLIYLLMPDRFACGDPGINNVKGMHDKVDRDKHFGRHGGDLQGVIDHLDYLADLGVTTLWMTPPQIDNEKEESYHGYACADYYHIDPRFGTNELYKQLVEKCHLLNLKVIMDAVPNHCGAAHWWMKDLPFKEWVHQHDKYTQSNNRLATISDPNHADIDLNITTDGWFDTFMPDMGIENPFLLQYFRQLYIWWIEWADLDGLRVDTFPYNEKNAIAQWTKYILEEYPNLNIVGECWHSAAPIVAYWDGGNKNKDGYTSNLPSVMDFPLQEAINGGLATGMQNSDEGMNCIYEALALDFVYSNPKSLLIFLDNHDTPRFADEVNGNKDLFKLGLTLLATLRGIPQLYYGTEYGFRSQDPSGGHGPARIDFEGGWEGDKRDLFKGKKKSKKETEIFEHTKKLFNWRKEAIAIHKGQTIHFIPEKNTYSFFRYTDNEAVFIFLNLSDKAAKINWDRYQECTQGYTKGISILDEKDISIGDKVTVKSKTSLIIEFQK